MELIRRTRREIDSKGRYKYYCLFQCPICGREVEKKRDKGLKAKSCGCTRNMHGLSRHPIYYIWKDMRSRCHNPNNKSYLRYGGRGITVYEEWRDGPESFFEWSIKNNYRKGLTLDRIDNDKGYSPENCRYVTKSRNAYKKYKDRQVKKHTAAVECTESLCELIAHIQTSECGKELSQYLVKIYPPSIMNDFSPGVRAIIGSFVENSKRL